MSSSSSPSPSPRTVQRRARSVSFAEAEAARESTPAATAGEGAVPAPAHMSVRMLLEQCCRLVGVPVVVSAASAMGDAPALYAGKLNRGLSEGTFVLLRSSCYNYCAQTVPHVGEDEAWDVPTDGWVYTRIVALSVHQTEAAQAHVGGLEQDLGRRDAMIAELRREVACLREAANPVPLSSSSSHGASAGAVPRNVPRELCEVNSVLEWMDDLEMDAETLVARLKGDCLWPWMDRSSGSHVLEEMFRRLRGWIRSAARFSGWERNPEFVALGDALWVDVRRQVAAIRKGVSRSAVDAEMRKGDPESDQYLLAAEAVASRNRGSKVGAVRPYARHNLVGGKGYRGKGFGKAGNDGGGGKH